MTINEIKSILSNLEQIAFELPDGSLVPNHFHVTEVGKINKHFIDCGGVERHEKVANFQLWNADDYDHRLHPEKLVHIIELTDKILDLGDLPIEVEYQGPDTIGKYNLQFNGENFLLTNKFTDCLAKSSCGLPEPKKNIKLSVVREEATSCCEPSSGCC